MSAALQLVQAEPLVLAGVDCDQGYDFVVWIQRGESEYFAPISVYRVAGEIDRVEVDDLKCWWGENDLTVAEARAFVRDHQLRVRELADEAFEARRRRWL